MVTFVASFIGAAAVFARVTSAVPMEYGMGWVFIPQGCVSNELILS